eukprot:scaffold280870_cov13-Tisochrysis_lutea.AAC.1
MMGGEPAWGGVGAECQAGCVCVGEGKGGSSSGSEGEDGGTHRGGWRGQRRLKGLLRKGTCVSPGPAPDAAAAAAATAAQATAAEAAAAAQASAAQAGSARGAGAVGVP